MLIVEVSGQEVQNNFLEVLIQKTVFTTATVIIEFMSTMVYLF